MSRAYPTADRSGGGREPEAQADRSSSGGRINTMNFEVRLGRMAELLHQIMDMQMQAEERMDKAEALHAREIHEARESHTRDIQEIRAELRRGIRMSIEEHRSERVRRQDLDNKITQLAAAQLVTEEKRQRLIDALRPSAGPTNGSGSH